MYIYREKEKMLLLAKLLLAHAASLKYLRFVYNKMNMRNMQYIYKATIEPLPYKYIHINVVYACIDAPDAHQNYSQPLFVYVQTSSGMHKLGQFRCLLMCIYASTDQHTASFMLLNISLQKSIISKRKSCKACI